MPSIRFGDAAPSARLVPFSALAAPTQPGEAPVARLRPPQSCGCSTFRDQATLRHLQQRAIPFVFSDYSEQSVEKGLAFARHHAAMAPSCGVRLNPFRAPMRLPLVDGGSVGHPTLSNGFFAAFNTPPGAFDAPGTVVESETHIWSLFCPPRARTRRHSDCRRR